MPLSNSLELIFYKAYADIRAESSRSYLGLLWWIIEPILYLSAFYILFVLILQRNDPNFIPSFLCGSVVWKWFDSGIKGGSHTISSHHELLQQVYVPKFIFPIIAVLGSTARFIPVFLVFTVFLLLYGISANYSWLAIPLIIFVQFFLIIAAAMLVGAITPFLPDLRVAIDNVMMLLFFLSGIFFNINEVHEPVKSYLLLNPMARLIAEYRNVMIRGVWPNFENLILIFFISIATIVLALILLKRMDQRYGKVRF